MHAHDLCLPNVMSLGFIYDHVSTMLFGLHSIPTIAATHRSAASLLYTMGLISHYGQQGWNKKEEVIKNEELKIKKMVCFLGTQNVSRRGF